MIVRHLLQENFRLARSGNDVCTMSGGKVKQTRNGLLFRGMYDTEEEQKGGEKICVLNRA